jgi:hypothetical protein
MKGIARELGEMNISLKPYAKPINKILYRLNLMYKKKVKAEIDKMLETRIVELVVELESISPMVVHDRKTRGITICVDFRKLNDACLHDPFPTTFID